MKQLNKTNKLQACKIRNYFMINFYILHNIGLDFNLHWHSHMCLLVHLMCCILKIPPFLDSKCLFILIEFGLILLSSIFVVT